MQSSFILCQWSTPIHLFAMGCREQYGTINMADELLLELTLLRLLRLHCTLVRNFRISTI